MNHNSSPKITTIITTYKRPQLLKKAIQSVLNQTYSNFQVCVYDNASNDETREIMEEFLQKDSRVKYHCHPENIGMMENYKFAFSHINTPFFSILSDDDSLLPHFYETALPEFEKYPDAAYVACGVNAIDNNQRSFAEPLNHWPREGYYEVPEGLLELLSSKSKIPIPNGILFQHEIVKNVSPDWRKGIQLMWDPDYLMQIAIKYPLVIKKHTCALFFVHPNAFSSGFYQNMGTTFTSFKNYLKATFLMVEKLKPNTSPSIKQAKNSFVEIIREEMLHYIRIYVFKKELFNILKLTALVYYYHGLDHRYHFLYVDCKQIVKFHLLAQVKAIYHFLKLNKAKSYILHSLKKIDS